MCVCVPIGACVWQHECAFLRMCNFYTYLPLYMYTCVGFTCAMPVQSTQRCCMAQETGGDNQMENSENQGHFLPSCQVLMRHITPTESGKAVAFLSSQSHSSFPRGKSQRSYHETKGRAVPGHAPISDGWEGLACVKSKPEKLPKPTVNVNIGGLEVLHITLLELFIARRRGVFASGPGNLPKFCALR